MKTQVLKYFHPRRGLTLVKQGFSWPAFFFGSLWALARRVYPLFFLMSVLDLVLWFVTGYAEAQGALGPALIGLLCTLIYAVLRGKYANSWLRQYLVSQGYVLRNQQPDT